MPTLLHEILDISAACLPDKIAIITDEGVITYRTLANNSRRLAASFQRLGVKRGDRIALCLPSGIPLVTALLAASRIGAVFFVVGQAVKPFVLRQILEDSFPALIVAPGRIRDGLDLAEFSCLLTLNEWDDALKSPTGTFGPVISSDLVCLVYTSGSTGKPKGVMSSHHNVVFAVDAIQQRLNYRESDVIGCFLPLSFDYGLYQIFLTFNAGATLALGSDAHAGPVLFRKLEEWGVTGLPIVPSLGATLIALGKRARGQLLPLRFITNTGAHLPRTYIQELQALMPTCEIYLMFGLTECKRVSILSPDEVDRKPHSVGLPLPATECLILDDAGAVLPPGRIGELVVRGRHVMQGYWNSPDLTTKRFRKWGPGQETALFTGDLCSLDEEGYLYFHGRTDDVYKQGGFRISILEVEDATCDIPGVRQAAVLPPQDNEPAVLFVSGQIDESSVIAQLRERLEDYKMPPRVLMLEQMPLTAHGKVDRIRLRTYLGGNIGP